MSSEPLSFKTFTKEQFNVNRDWALVPDFKAIFVPENEWMDPNTTHVLRLNYQWLNLKAHQIDSSGVLLKVSASSVEEVTRLFWWCLQKNFKGIESDYVSAQVLGENSSLDKWMKTLQFDAFGFSREEMYALFGKECTMVSEGGEVSRPLARKQELATVDGTVSLPVSVSRLRSANRAVQEEGVSIPTGSSIHGSKGSPQ